MISIMTAYFQANIFGKRNKEISILQLKKREYDIINDSS